MNTSLALVPFIEREIDLPIEPIPVIPTATPTPKFFQMIPGIIGDIIFPLPSKTPVPPTAVPPAPTPTPTNVVEPKITVIPTKILDENQVTPSVDPLVPTVVVSASPSPTPMPQAGITQENFLWGAILVLLLIVIGSNWAKIKQWLHEKTG